MREEKRKVVTRSMIGYELRNVVGNPFVHIFGVGMPALIAVLVTKVAVAEVSDPEMIKMISTSVFLGVGALIPMAAILMGYSVMQAMDLEKGIPERLQLFGIRSIVTICNRALCELIFMSAAFAVYFMTGAVFLDLEAPTVSGALLYVVCMVVFSFFCFILAHAIATLVRKFSLTYCLVMILYFVCMILGGMMGVSYEALPAPLQTAAKLLPVTYFNRDFYTIWTGESYSYVPMLQSYLFFGAAAGILLFAALRRKRASTGDGTGNMM